MEGSPPSRLRRTLRTVVPWCVAAAIFAWLFHQVPVADAWQAMRQARLDLFLPVMLVAVVLWFWIDSAAFAYLFTRFNAQLPFREARSLRGMTYILTPINWNLGSAAVIVHLRTSKGISALQATSSMLFYQAVDGMVLAGYALVGALMLPLTPEIASLRSGAFVFVVLPIVLLWLFMGGWPRFRWLVRLRAMDLFSSHQTAVVRDVLVLAGLKTVYFSVFLGMFGFGTAAFGIDLPVGLVLASTPIIMMAGALPITPAGLGTQQAAMMYFYAPYGDEASILAFGLLFPIALVLLRVLIGTLYLRDLPKLRQALEAQRAASS